MLSKGNFLDLYVYGFDFPEAYTIEKSGHYYYAFYVPAREAGGKPVASTRATWKGEIELRGLPGGVFRVSDYVHHKDLGAVVGPTGKLRVEINGNLLLEASPDKP